MTTFKKYDLTKTQLTKLTRLCVQEQGSIKGIKAEASQMANLLETNATRQRKWGTDGTGLYNMVRDSGWYYRAAYYMDNGSATAKQIEAVREVLVEGLRTLPQYVDEHDCFSDIKSISTGSVRNRADYIKDVTVIKNKMGSTYTFDSFPDKGSDPFGYTASAYEYVKNHGGDVPEPYRVDVVTTLPEIWRGDEGDAVSIWQVIVGVTVDGDFGAKTETATKAFQRTHGLTEDGIVGAKTWAKGLASIN